MDVERDGGGLEGRVLFLAGPNQLRIEVGIVVQFLARLYLRDGLDVIVDLVRRQRWIGLGRYKSDGRIVDALLAGVFVAVNRTLLRVPRSAILPFSPCHGSVSLSPTRE